MSFPSFPVSFSCIFYPSSWLCFFLVFPFSTNESSHSVPMSLPIQYQWVFPFSTNECSIQYQWVFHSVPMSVPFSANDRLIQYQWGHHSLLLADIPPKTLGLTPPWHLLDTSLTPIYDINDTDTVCYLVAWHLDTYKWEKISDRYRLVTVR